MQQHIYEPPAPKKPHRRRGKFSRLVRGYLMFVGACTTIFGLILLLVQLFVEIDKWIPKPPIG